MSSSSVWRLRRLRGLREVRGGGLSVVVLMLVLSGWMSAVGVDAVRKQSSGWIGSLSGLSDCKGSELVGRVSGMLHEGVESVVL